MDKKHCKIQDSSKIYTVLNIKGNNISVQDKNMVLHTTLDKVTFLDENQISKKASSYNISLVERTVPNEIMLRHKLKEEAILELDKYLDEAYLAKLGRVRIIHGKYGGVLRDAVHEYLKSHPYVKSFKIADYSEGGFGVTVAILGNK